MEKKITKGKFLAYEAVRKSGVTNMFDIECVGLLSGLGRDEIIDIMKNYDKYSKKYLHEQKV